MKTEKRKRPGFRLSFTARRAVAGRLFLLPWMIGALYFFVLPFIQGVVYTVNKVSFTPQGVQFTFVGIKNCLSAFTDLDFTKNLTSSLTNMIPQVVIIVFFSLFVAIILRGKFRGRALARAIFFLPVIISSGVVITVLKENVMSGVGMGMKEASFLFEAPSFEDTLSNLGLPQKVLEIFTSIVNQLFDLMWKSGVQILLLLAAVNNIPQSSYEVADMEGATEWEKFWKITFPMVSPTLLVAVIYSIIDSFTDYGNSVMRMVSEKMSQGYYEYSSTLAFIYFGCVLLIIGLVGLILSRRVFYASE